MNLACETVPSIDEDGALGRLDSLGVLDSLPGNLGESVTGNHLSTLHGTETILLAVTAIPYPVPEEVADEHGRQNQAVPAVLGRIVVREIDGAMAVRQGNTSQIPEDEHKAPFFIIHVPRSDNELLTLGASVGVEVVSHDEEHDFSRDVAVALPLTGGGAQAENKQEVPWHANLTEHLEVQDAEHTRVELSAHEEVIDGVASHAVLLSAIEGRKVRDKADQEAAQDGDGQKRAKLINGIIQRPDAGEMQNSQDSKCCVESDKGVAVILELLASLVRKRLTPAPDTRQRAVANALKDEIRPIPEPSLCVGKSASVHVVDELSSKGTPTLAGSTRRELAIVVGGTDPHIPHEYREKNHQGQSTKGTAKLELARVIDLGVLTLAPSINNPSIC